MTVHPFIEAEKQDGHSVKRVCELLKVSRTAFYARRTGKPGPRAVQDAELTQQITAVHERSRGTYGVPRVHAVLKREGAGCGRRRIARLMRAAGLEGRHRRRRHVTTVPDPRAATRPDLVVRKFAPDATGLDFPISVNALAESFFQGLKRELLHGRPWTSKAQTRLELFRWLSYYNRRRRHSTLGYLTPAEFENWGREWGCPGRTRCQGIPMSSVCCRWIAVCPVMGCERVPCFRSVGSVPGFRPWRGCSERSLSLH
ncbi:IS3 family transposase [Streptomyces sp. NPDC005728]|uniref:IS3 family transposase n=1 Tax=Streptomyces sp. NPDC005728 TaxID=3157054 RepID=UPI0033CFA092